MEQHVFIRYLMAHSIYRSSADSHRHLQQPAVAAHKADKLDTVAAAAVLGDTATSLIRHAHLVEALKEHNQMAAAAVPAKVLAVGLDSVEADILGVQEDNSGDFAGFPEMYRYANRLRDYSSRWF